MRALLSRLWPIAWAAPGLAVATLVPTWLLLNWALSGYLFGTFLLSARRGLATSLMLTILAVTYLSLSLTSAVSFFMQGSMPDLRFLAHLDASTLAVAVQAYFWPTFAGILCFIGLVLSVATLHIWRPSRPPRHRIIGPLALVVAVLTFTPGHYIGYFLFNYYNYNKNIQAQLRMSIQRPETAGLLPGKDPKNLILIYTESLEQTYLDTTLFGDVLPELKVLRTEGLSFTDVRQYPGTGWTVAGIVASQCGLPLISRTDGNQILASLETPFQSVTCLAEFLGAEGYATIFMGGASLAFAGKGAFLRANGYAATFGRDELPKFAQESHWGMYDAQLFEEAARMRDRLAESEAPFFLTLLTLDTHAPYGHPSPKCEAGAAAGRDILVAVACSDRLIGDFIRDTLQSSEADDTVIAVFSDHLALRNTASHALEKSDRRLLFLILNADARPQEIASPGTHFDVAPTLLDAIGFGAHQFGLGRSLLSNAEGGVFEAGLEPKDIEAPELTDIFPAIALPQDIVANTERITIHDNSFLIRSGHIRRPEAVNELLFGRFLAIGVGREDARPVQIIADPKEFLEVIAKKPDDIWVIYNDGRLDCRIISDCVGSPKLIVTSSMGGPSLVRTGEGELHISKTELARFLDTLP